MTAHARGGCSPIWFGRVVPGAMLGTTRRELRSSRRRDDGYAEVDRRDAGQALGLLAFLPEEGEGEVDALAAIETTLAAATQKLEAMQTLATHHATAMGMPSFRPTAGRSSSDD